MTDRYVAILDRSAGNDSVGEMWQETKVFAAAATVDDVMDWAFRARGGGGAEGPSTFRVTLTRAHDDA